MDLDPRKLEALHGDVFSHLAAATALPLVYLGDRLGLFRALAGHGPLQSDELARRTGTFPRYVREWASAMAASGYVDYDPATDCFSLSPEQTVIFATEGHPAFVQGAIESITSLYLDEPRIETAFRSGEGVGWGEHSACCFEGTRRFFQPLYADQLVPTWLPALDGVVDQLRAGARVADVGCGHGASTILMAQAFPRSHFHGFDFHEPSIAQARRHAAEAGISNVTFDTASAKDFGGSDFALVCIFDALHDMGDPAGVARHVRGTLADHGTWMVVEPMAGDHLADNLHLVGKMFYAFSTMICTPASRAQEVGAMLGAQAGEARLREVILSGGFTRVRRATATPFNLVLEARP